ncbi:MAG TPA: ANTAR domain-containing protein [Bryobacteraceae bacterium]|jgi:ANTAR domain|nr:ANTAR domain-containing protein [Bryobacteraceae bacterium]
MSPEPLKDGALPRSLHPLALLAAREAGAVGFAIHQCNPAGQREVKLGWGVPVPEGGETRLTVSSFPLRAGDDVTGVLTFVFREASISRQAQSLLDQVAGAIEEIWRLSLVPAAYARSAARIGELETELADSKIADRARGLLASGSQPSDAIGTIVRHVESVLRPGQLGTVLAQLFQEIEREIEERELANRAKAVLQTRYGMSEDQAHVHLRLVSRKSRKRLRDVARDLLEETAVSGR